MFTVMAVSGRILGLSRAERFRRAGLGAGVSRILQKIKILGTGYRGTCFPNQMQPGEYSMGSGADGTPYGISVAEPQRQP
jgi:hypothetical protein